MWGLGFRVSGLQFPPKMFQAMDSNGDNRALARSQLGDLGVCT